MGLLKQRNAELESDMEVCRAREAELLLFTQQLTDKNVRLQSEFTTMETKVIPDHVCLVEIARFLILLGTTIDL